MVDNEEMPLSNVILLFPTFNNYSIIVNKKIGKHIGGVAVKAVEKAEQLIEQLNLVLVGKKDKVTLTVTTLLAGGHLLLEDVPGVGKTTLANALAKSLDCSFGRIQFTPDTLPSDVTGVSVYNMKTGKFDYQKGPIMNQIILADEINRTAPKTQASLLEAMEEKQITVDGIIYPLKDPFMVIATQNPIDFVGTYHLPEAQMDRFLMRISLGYPDNDKECQMVRQFLNNQRVQGLKPVMCQEDILEMQKATAAIQVHKDIIKFIVDIVEHTRTAENLTLGASPRATLALVRASQATAFLNHREFVIPDDVLAIVRPVLCHRLLLSMEAKVNQISTESIIKEVLSKVQIPIL